MSRRLLARLAVLLLPLWSAASFAGVTPYPPYPGAEPSPAYTVTVDGQPVFTHRFLTYNQHGWMDYAHFAMTGKVRVTVTLIGRNVLTCDVRPLAYGIRPRIAGDTATFELDRPRYLLVFINEQARYASNGLMLFAEPPEESPPRLGDPNVVNIHDYKVDATGKNLETAKINQAITDVAARPGGGVLFFPKSGIYLTGTLFMKSNVKLYVEAGALLQGSNKSEDYPAIAQEGDMRINSCLIYFRGVENAGLMGRGTIDMDGYPALWNNRNAGTRDPGRSGVQGFVIYNSRNVSFRDLLVRRAAYWTVNIIESEYFSTRNFKIANRRIQYNEDLYDFTSSSHILIEDGFGLTMDDFFAFYRSRNVKAGPEDKGMEDIVVKGFVGYGYDSGLALGYGLSTGVRNVRLEDVHFVANMADYAIWVSFTPEYFAAWPYPEGRRTSNVPLEDFRFVNCTFENDGGFVYIAAGEAPLKNFVFENCTVHSPTRPSLISGKNVSPILFKNLKINGRVIRSADELRRAGVDLSVPARFTP